MRLFSQSIEDRLRADLDQVSKERASLQVLTSNLQNVESESKRVQEETRAKLEAQIATLTSDK